MHSEIFIIKKQEETITLINENKQNIYEICTIQENLGLRIGSFRPNVHI